MKAYSVFIGILFVCLIHSKEIKDLNELIGYIKNVDYAQLTDDLKFISKSLNSKISDHYCCNVDDRFLTFENRTRTTSYSEIETYSHIVGYEAGSCMPAIGVVVSENSATFAPCRYPIYQNYTIQKVKYKLEYYSVPVEIHHCPEEHVVCCDGFTMLNGHCTDNEYAAQLQVLIDLGLLQIGIGRK